MNDGTTFREGLVDASDEKDFFLKLKNMEKKVELPGAERFQATPKICLLVPKV